MITGKIKVHRQNRKFYSLQKQQNFIQVVKYQLRLEQQPKDTSSSTF